MKSRLLATSLLAGCVAALPLGAFAQDTDVSELVVTGSRIPRPNLEQPTPVATVSQVMIENSGTSSLGDILAQLPALNASGSVRANSDSAAGVGGLSFPNLRDLGTSRTLTLVNGQRHVSGDAGDTAVDLNTIPTALVKNVEVITGGASAIYGSDAVTGVINIILKDDFEGIEVNVQGGGPLNDKYGQTYSGSVTGGMNFGDGRGNITLTGFADKQERVRGSDIHGLRDWATIENPADTGPADGIPDRLYKPYILTEYFSANGNIIGANTFAPITGFDAAGAPVAIPPRIGDNNFYYGAFAGPCAVCTSTDLESVPIPRQSRYGLASTFHYDITPKIRFNGDLKYVRTKTLDTFSSSFTTFEYLLDPDNAFITPAIQAVLDAHPEEDGFFYVNRTNWDIGGRNDDTLRKTFRGVFGFEGEADAGFADVNWKASYNYGRTRNKFHSTGGLIPGNFNSAIDAVVNPATGQVQCRRDVPATWYPGYAPIDAADLTNETCVPFNLFGAQNSAAAIDYVSYEGDRTHTITQQVAQAIFDFDTSRFFELPGGPVKVVGGFEWRRETSKNINDPFIQSGITETAPQPNALGGFEVKEAFTEVNLPFLRNAPFAYLLSADFAVRVADYSHAGSATAWKTGGIWAPVRDLRFRGTYSRAVRAPNITEAFLPATAGFNAIFDPCEAASLAEDPDRTANCKALGVTFEDATDNQFPGVTSGNPDLKPEKAETWTVGFILEPRWTPGLALTVDYYNIKIKDAISFLDPQDAADNCVDSPSLALAYCNLIIRDPTSKQIVSYISSYLNQSLLTTAGYDINLTYKREALGGTVTGSINATYIEKLRQFAFADYPDEVDREEGEVGDPRWRFISSLSFNKGPWTVTWESQFMDKSRRNKDVSAERTDRPFVESVWYHDVIGRYRFEDLAKGVEVYAGVNNIFGKTIPVGLTGNTTSTAGYDIFGRYGFVGVKAKF